MSIYVSLYPEKSKVYAIETATATATATATSIATQTDDVVDATVAVGSPVILGAPVSIAIETPPVSAVAWKDEDKNEDEDYKPNILCRCVVRFMYYLFCQCCTCCTANKFACVFLSIFAIGGFTFMIVSISMSLGHPVHLNNVTQNGTLS